MPKFSLIIPVYNRPQEISDLVASLDRQTFRDFEAVIVEDGSTTRCERECAGRDYIHYYYKPNEGRSVARNHGIERSRGEWLVFVDSDVVLPDDYFETLDRELSTNRLDCFGGPDAAHDSFSTTQKAISFAMTSFLTTGGIRGGKKSMEKFVPRSFNMGYKREVYDRVGGFREMFSEDIDMSTRIRQAGFKIGLIPGAKVYHKRRVDMGKFWRQVHVFGRSRITLKLLYPDSLKLVHTLPALAVMTGVILLILGVTLAWWFLIPLLAYMVALFVAALFVTRSLKVATKAVPAGVIQICGYGTGFIRAYVAKILLGRGRDIDEEIKARKGK